jgi:demethylmenaquinone methyltransferase/2-methoxy-6-polyprenyl-1,4-benzoquinol methylase
MPLPTDQRERSVKNIFDGIAGRYDLLNRVISLHLDTLWRKKTVKALDLKTSDGIVLDLGTGTGDLALTAAKSMGRNGMVLGMDFSQEMLRLAQEKKRRVKYGSKTAFVVGNALDPPFKDEAFDAITTAFVLRNIVDLNLFFIQAFRLLRPGGKLASLDMFPPPRGFFSFFYSIYFYRMVPRIGAGLSRNGMAYQYLSDSVKRFDSPEGISRLIQGAGFEKIKTERFLKGAVCLQLAEKPGRH